ncbi:hypothetical protein PAPHI01_0619 [Pancytospora philotis]|nr:hypothetical protein PAPHI01_0619 [Pancytospora philotis]
MIAELKIEDGVVLATNGESGDWAVAQTSMIPELEELLRRLQTAVYPAKTRRENVSFDRACDIASGSIKAFKDEDGDFTVTYEQTAQPSIVVDEDAAFGLGAAAEIPEQEFAVNHWGTAKSKELADASKAKAVPKAAQKTAVKPDAFEDALSDLHIRRPGADGGREPPVGQFAVALEKEAPLRTPESKKRAAVKRTADHMVAPAPCYKKRPARDSKPSNLRFISGVRTLLLNSNCKKRRKNAANRGANEPVSFISRRLACASRNIDPRLFINSIRFNRKRNNRSVFESNFHLEQPGGDVGRKSM